MGSALSPPPAGSVDWARAMTSDISTCAPTCALNSEAWKGACAARKRPRTGSPAAAMASSIAETTPKSALWDEGSASASAMLAAQTTRLNLTEMGRQRTVAMASLMRRSSVLL